MLTPWTRSEAGKSLNNFKSSDFDSKLFGEMRSTPYLCIVFFMVLDLRLTMKIGCRETTFPFLYT